ncbi:hypothetical protein Mgra_00009106 [Meloidogyne graminicola]|uniref:Protein kinase domain-containing protein n=1 Tax=Meloidogyne graminicola TaxID=189291 RepID=A0A8S9ZDV2_9BILA|nr:hypothetical protein Mgra_00009106 [Meloidogyne graminicola]
MAPEYDHLTEATTQADIYSFGVCALEMATIGALLSGSLNGGSEKEKAVSGDSGTPSTAGGCGLHLVTEELIRKGIDSLEDPEQKEFIERCLEHDPNQRANVEELLNRLGLPEPEKQDETSLDEDGFLEDQQQADNVRLSHEPTPGVVLPERAVSSPPQEAAPNIEKTTTIQTSAATQKQAPAANIITNTKQDGYNSHFNTITPITTASTAIVSSTVSTSGTVVLTTTPASTTTTTTTNTLVSHPHSAQDEGYHTNQSIVESPGQVVDTLAPSEKAAVVQHQQHRETRQIVQMHAEVFDQGGYQLRIQLQLDDQMNRQLTAPLKEGDTAETLTEELVKHGFISESNSSRMRELLETVQLVKRTNP